MTKNSVLFVILSSGLTSRDALFFPSEGGKTAGRVSQACRRREREGDMWRDLGRAAGIKGSIGYDKAFWNEFQWWEICPLSCEATGILQAQERTEIWREWCVGAWYWEIFVNIRAFLFLLEDIGSRKSIIESGWYLLKEINYFIYLNIDTICLFAHLNLKIYLYFCSIITIVNLHTVFRIKRANLMPLFTTKPWNVSTLL